MRRVLLLVAVAAACGGPQVPEHNGYKSEKSKPWKKFKTLKLDDKGEAKTDGDLSYPDRRRAAWIDIDTPSAGDLDLKVEITPPGDAVNDNFDLGFEVLDPGNRMLIRKDAEEGDGQGDVQKEAHLKSLPPGHYLIHLYLQGRLDTAEYTLHAAFKPGKAAEGKSDFPAQVAFTPALPMVPISDDTPKNYKPPTAVVVHSTKHQPKKDPTPPPVTTLAARIIGVSVVSGGTQITVGRGTSSGAQAGMKGKIVGVANGGFSLAACDERKCTATISGVTPDQIKGSGNVVLTP
jgi:hypothetical protein